MFVARISKNLNLLIGILLSFSLYK